MTRPRFIALAAALAALTVPTSAQAAHRPAPPIGLALPIAADYWGVEGTCPADSVGIVWLADLGVNPDTGDSAGGRAVLGGCASGQPTIWLNSSVDVGFAMRCTIVVHEYGHLIGLGHSDDASVMNPWWMAWHLVRPCVAAQRSWRRHHWR